jgi:hypothetical protein
VLQEQGDLVGARPLYERAQVIFEKTIGPEHAGTAMNLSDLGSLLQEQSDLAGAQRLYERALAIYVGALGPEHPSTANTRERLRTLPRA